MPMTPTKWIIWSNEHQAYWRPNSHGYTRRIEDAGRYSYQEAHDICFPGRGRVGLPEGEGDWPPPEMMFPDPEPHAPSLPADMRRYFRRQLA